MLFAWRNDAATRAASLSGEVVEFAAHKAWLEHALENPARRLFIAMNNNAPVGTARADLSDGVWVLSWTVAPEWRGRGIGKLIVAQLMEVFDGAVRAEVKKANIASATIAAAAGFEFAGEEAGVLHYRRGPLTQGGFKR